MKKKFYNLYNLLINNFCIGKNYVNILNVMLCCFCFNIGVIWKCSGRKLKEWNVRGEWGDGYESGEGWGRWVEVRWYCEEEVMVKR